MTKLTRRGIAAIAIILIALAAAWAWAADSNAYYHWRIVAVTPAPMCGAWIENSAGEEVYLRITYDQLVALGPMPEGAIINALDVNKDGDTTDGTIPAGNPPVPLTETFARAK